MTIQVSLALLFEIFIILSLFTRRTWEAPDTENYGRRGIIIAMGPVRSHFAGTYSTVKSLREEFSCHLPIEIWTYESEMKELPPSVLNSFNSIHDTTLHTLKEPSGFRSEWGNEKDWYKDYLGFSAMARALWSTSLEEVVAIDVDAVLFTHPAMLFDSAQYKETGTLFLLDKFLSWWPHYYTPYDEQWLHHFISHYDGNFHHIPIQNVSSLKYFEREEFRAFIASRSQHLAESSIVLFDKRRHRRTMAILEDITNRHGFELYRNTYGDKESYWIACELAGVSYAFNDWASSHWGVTSESKSQVFRETTSVRCGGNSFQEPGAFHYLPGSAEIPMSFNGCKEPGCVRYGMKKIHVSPRLSYRDALEKFATYQGEIKNNTSWMVRKFDPSPKDELNGKMTTGVKILQSKWFDVIECLKLSDQITKTLSHRRSRMIEGAKIYCIDKQYCGSRKST